MRVRMNYGRQGLDVDLPDGIDATVIRKPEMPVAADPKGAVARALEQPVGCRPLVQEAKGRKSACILICDITRPVPNGTVLPPLIRALLAAGLSASDITVLVATGLHRPNEGAELEELVGDPWVLKTVKVVNHFARDDAAHTDLGLTPRGTRVRLDKRFVNADLHIVTGLVEPHFMAGYSGGRKVISPGVAHAETITTFHNAAFMEHPNATNCVLEGNPLHEEQLAIVRMLGGAFAVNTVIDEDRRLAFVNFGEIVESHAEAVAFMRRYAEVPIHRRFGTVLTSSAGYPLDKTYYQTVKGMVAPLEILQPGGNLIIVSECSEGIGSPEYVESQRRFLELGPDAFLRMIQAQSHARIDEWETEMQLRPMRVGAIHLLSGMPAEQRALTGVATITAAALGETIRACVAKSGDRSLAVVPEGPYVVPRFAG